jgi:adenylyltransferase/sulfurtransferase
MSQPQDLPEITALELQERLEGEQVPLLVDVREAFERRIADLPDHDQLRIPTGEFMQRVGEIDADRDVVLYCRTGSRSEWATRVLLHHGHERVYNLKGGVMAWRDQVDPSLQAY